MLYFYFTLVFLYFCLHYIYLYHIYYLYKQGCAGTWPPIQSLPAHNFAFSGWAGKALIVNKTFRYLMYLYKFVTCYTGP